MALCTYPLAAPPIQAGDQDPDLFFTDRPRDGRLGTRNREYLSFFADEVCTFLSMPQGSHHMPPHMPVSVQAAPISSFCCSQKLLPALPPSLLRCCLSLVSRVC